MLRRTFCQSILSLLVVPFSQLKWKDKIKGYDLIFYRGVHLGTDVTEKLYTKSGIVNTTELTINYESGKQEKYIKETSDGEPYGMVWVSTHDFGFGEKLCIKPTNKIEYRLDKKNMTFTHITEYGQGFITGLKQV